MPWRWPADLPGDDIAAWERRLEALDGVRQLAGGVVEDDLSIITAAARHIEGALTHVDLDTLRSSFWALVSALLPLHDHPEHREKRPQLLRRLHALWPPDAPRTRSALALVAEEPVG